MADEPRPALRARLRAARRAIGSRERLAAARAVAVHLARLGLPRPRTRIAAYRAMDGEIDPSIVLHRALALGCDVYLPVIMNVRSRRMCFAPLSGTGEPVAAAATGNSRWLDLVLVPLVGFDCDGNRLGMGAGFYDRHFAWLRHRKYWRRPLLVGIAFEIQRLDRLPPQRHDVPLWRIVTERGVYGRAGAAR
jgi:5-formyltetrahydrofolate cyclo-ligase